MARARKRALVRVIRKVTFFVWVKLRSGLGL